MKINKIGLFLKRHYKKIALLFGAGIVASGLIYVNSDKYYHSLYERDLREKAGSGDSKAQYFLSSKLYFKDRDRAQYWLTKSANNGYLPAMVRLCSDNDFEWCKKAASLGDDKAIFRVAESYEKQENYPAAITWYKKVAERWFFHRDDYYADKAARALADLYVKLDNKEEAEEWYKKRISLEDDNETKALLMRQLADKYGDGKPKGGKDYHKEKLDFGDEENEKKEFKLRRAAADLDGYQDRYLARAYIFGYGTKQDIPKGLKIYEELAIVDKSAAFELADYYKDGSISGLVRIEKNIEKAKIYYKMACKDFYLACEELKELENQE